MDIVQAAARLVFVSTLVFAALWVLSVPDSVRPAGTSYAWAIALAATALATSMFAAVVVVLYRTLRQQSARRQLQRILS